MDDEMVIAAPAPAGAPTALSGPLLDEVRRRRRLFTADECHQLAAAALPGYAPGPAEPLG
jgi:hypothetical protein